MIDVRIMLVAVPSIVLWCTVIPSHRISNGTTRRITIGRPFAVLAGSKSNQVNARAFGRQLGYLSIIAWYLLLVFSDSGYLSANAYVYAVLLGSLTSVGAAQILWLMAK